MPKKTLQKTEPKTTKTTKQTTTEKKVVPRPHTSEAKIATPRRKLAVAFRRKRMMKSEGEEQKVLRAESGTRVLKGPKPVWYKPRTWPKRKKRQKRVKPPVPNYRPLPKARIMFWETLKQLWAYKKLFGGILAIYGVLDLIFVRGFSNSTDLTAIKGALDSLSHGFGSKISDSISSYAYLLQNSGGSGASSNSSAYQAVLLFLGSMAIIWAFRQAFMRQKGVRVRDSFYSGMYPLIPFLLLFLLIGVQLLPMAAGTALYSMVIQGGIAVHIWEKIMWFSIMLLTIVWSFRMLTVTIFALYIVTLPDMEPLRAYRSAKQLVYGRRLQLWRKIIFLPVALLALSALIEVPLILFVTPIASWMFFVVSILFLPIVHGYLYRMYREML